ncbi:Conserved protein of unknown function (part 1) [Mycobacterium canettii CIPT 140070017]|nr:Conserved protein of unknown function (part 1) [Mycobacterium canettii CIPT 140070017]
MRDRREQQNLVGRHGETLLAEAAFTSVSYRRYTCARCSMRPINSTWSWRAAPGRRVTSP